MTPKGYRLPAVAIAGLLAAGCQMPLNPLFGPGSLPPGKPGPTFDVDSLLPARVIHGDNYVIERPVQVLDDRFVFRIRTRYGVILAHGMDMLDLRLREMYSIRLAESIRNDAHLQTGIAEGLRKTGQGLGQLLTDPGGTLLRAPEGVREMVTEKLDPADSRAGSLARRKLAAQVRCDPETNNPVLKWLLDEMSLKQDVGDFATGTALGLVVPVPGVGLLSTTADMEQMLATTPPHAVNQTIGERLEQMGLDPALCRRFCTDGNYTTLERLIFLQYFQPLRGIAGLPVVLESMVNVRTEAEALGRIHEVRIWAQLNNHRPIRQFVKAPSSAAVLKDGALAIVSTADYLTDAQDVVRTAAQYRIARRDATVILYTTARLSAQAQTALRAAGIELGGADASLH